MAFLRRQILVVDVQHVQRAEQPRRLRSRQSRVVTTNPAAPTAKCSTESTGWTSRFYPACRPLRYHSDAPMNAAFAKFPAIVASRSAGIRGPAAKLISTGELPCHQPDLVRCQRRLAPVILDDRPLRGRRQRSRECSSALARYRSHLQHRPFARERYRPPRGNRTPSGNGDSEESIQLAGPCILTTGDRRQDRVQIDRLGLAAVHNSPEQQHRRARSRQRGPRIVEA